LVVATAAGLICLGTAFVVSPWAGLGAGAMLALNAVYSLPPTRLSGRGGLAQLLLPLEYCAFPALLMALVAAPSAVTDGPRGGVPPDSVGQPGWRIYWLMVASMYVIFVGRVFLKDIRDELGDRATGKRTFTVRHGRHAAIICSALTTVIGTVALSLIMFLGYDAQPGLIFGFCALSLGGQMVALRQADRAHDAGTAVRYGGIYGRWISMKIFFYVMSMLLVRADVSGLTQAMVLTGTALVIICNVAMLYQQLALRPLVAPATAASFTRGQNFDK
jgi:4-hydroxybenzoate polyprenyltransferase